MESAHGGKVTLRLIASSGDGIDYAGQLSEGDRVCDVRARVRLADGAVVVTAEHGAAPEWLIALARALLRAAFRSAQAGAPWPRRLSRWRPSQNSDGSEP